MQTVFGSFNDRPTAQRAVDQLLARGFTNTSIHLQTGATSERNDEGTATRRGMVASVGNFFSNLFGDSDTQPPRKYAEAVHRGNSVVAVDTNNDSEVQMAESILGQLGTLNVDNRAD